MLWIGKVARVSLCVLVRFSPCRGLVCCEARSFFSSVKGSLPCTDIRMWYPGLTGRACSMLATARGDPDSWTIKPGSVGLGVTVIPGGPVCLHAALRQNSMEEPNMSRLSFRAYTREAQILRISKRRIWLRLGVILSLSHNDPRSESFALLPPILPPSICRIGTAHPHGDVNFDRAAITL